MDSPNITKESFWKSPAKSGTALGLLLAGAFVGSLLYCLPRKPTSYENHVDTFSLFNDAVRIKRTEQDGNYRMKGTFVEKVTYEFEFNKPGTYLFEGWARRYRANDVETENWQMNITQPPFRQSEDLDSIVYRLEGTRTIDGKIERDTALFRHYGLVSAIVAQGQEIP